MEHLNPKSKRVEKASNQSFLSLSMGMIQPEWLYMSHFFDEPSPENIPKPSSIDANQPSSSKPTIRISFRPRK